MKFLKSVIDMTTWDPREIEELARRAAVRNLLCVAGAARRSLDGDAREAHKPS
ncbi:MAG: hypothetical protein ACOYJA_04390 [Christensenellales bacterium]